MALRWHDGHKFTANISWCEEKYAYSATIAEFFNATTNIPFVSIGLCYMMGAHRLGLGKRYTLCYAFFSLIGIGSFLFHATLQKEAQLLDELPMMLMAGQAIWCMGINGRESLSTKITSAVLIYSLIAVGALIYLACNSYWIFHTIFAGLTALIIVGSTRLCMQHGHVVYPMKVSFWLNLLAFALWNIDVHLCQQLRNIRLVFGRPMDAFLQLHAWWHLLTALGLVWFVTGLALANPRHQNLILSVKLGVFPVPYLRKKEHLTEK